MALMCRICSRTNPADAHYCYHDGASLRDASRNGSPVAIGAQPFLSPFIFPSGRTCRTFDELLLACDAEWDEAKYLLHKGYLEGFLGGLGRADLALAARQAAREPDLDRAFDQFLGKLPSTTRQQSRLLAQPLEVNFGQLSRSTDRRFTLHLENQGMGLLYGTVSVDNTPWLALGEPPGAPQKLFQCHHDQALPVVILGKRLRAGAKPQEGRLVIESNGGIATVTVRIEVPVTPFPEGALAGARSPRQVAEKAKASPKEAAVLFEKGAVAEWYETNGWTYPVRGPSSSGLGAVQQFFEALGLVTPPKVMISTQSVQLQGSPGASLEVVVQVQAMEKRPVYAHAVSQTPWLRVGRVLLKGNVAHVPLQVPSVPPQPGQRLTGKAQVVSNGNQRFTVEVALTVAGTPPPVRDGRFAPPPGANWYEVPAPVLEVPPAAVPVLDVTPEVPLRPSTFFPEPVAEVLDVPAAVAQEDELAGRRSSRWLHLLPIAFLFFCLLVTFVRDLTAWMQGPPPEEPGEPVVDKEPRIALYFHDTEQEVPLGYGGIKPGDEGSEPTRQAIWEPSMRFGLVMLKADDPNRQGELKLTYERRGTSNNTVIRLDGNEWLFGERPFRPLEGPPMRATWPGRWKENQRDVELTGPGEGRKSVWVYDKQKVLVTQMVQIVPGAQSGLLDTCLVRYRMDNQDNRPHTVGLRFLLDTYIGDNDGVPFLIPGERQLCSTFKKFERAEDIPDFIQACEFEDLSHPGTIAQLQLKVAGLEPPSRVTLGSYPNPQLAKLKRDPRCLQEKTLWEVPVYSIHTLPKADSAVTIYWNEVELKPNEFREVGFTYGLGNVAASEAGGKLALTVGGSFTPGGEFTLTAYVSNPTPGQTVTLTLPEGFERIEGSAEQPVPPLPPGAASRNSPVTWKVKAGPKEGKYTLKVQSGKLVQTQAVKIKVRGIFGNN
jgi:hypothetical protein